jgi:uncharacterized membrane protein
MSYILIGFMAGLRSMTSLAAIAWSQKWGWLRPRGVFANTGSTPARALLSAAASGEHIVDKLPFTPSRLQTRSLIVRANTGGLSGAIVASAAGASPARGALLGAVGAILGSYAGYHFRIGLTSKAVASAEARGSSTEAAKLLVAVAEDVIAVAGSFWVLSRQRDAES